MVGVKLVCLGAGQYDWGEANMAGGRSVLLGTGPFFWV